MSVAQVLPLCKHAEPMGGCTACHLWATDEQYRAEIHKLRNAPYTPPQGVARTAPIVIVGPGEELKRIFDRMGFKEWEGCSCNAIRQEMNRLGASGCIVNRDRLVTMLKANVAAGVNAKKLTRLAKVGSALTMGRLFDLAVKRASANESA